MSAEINTEMSQETNTEMRLKLNEKWETFLKQSGVDFVYFVDPTGLPREVIENYQSVVLFGKALSKEYINEIREHREPKHKEMFNLEQKLDKLAIRLAEELTREGYASNGKSKVGVLPHKTIALRVGMGFIGKNNLLITEQYGCAFLMSKVLTTAPFITKNADIMEPKCGSCEACVKECHHQALYGTTWDITKTREDILNRKACDVCLQCMVNCPYTIRYSTN